MFLALTFLPVRGADGTGNLALVMWQRSDRQCWALRAVPLQAAALAPCLDDVGAIHQSGSHHCDPYRRWHRSVPRSHGTDDGRGTAPVVCGVASDVPSLQIIIPGAVMARPVHNVDHGTQPGRYIPRRTRLSIFPSQARISDGSSRAPTSVRRLAEGWRALRFENKHSGASP